MAAAKRGDLHTLTAFLDDGRDVNVRVVEEKSDGGLGLLHVAAAGGQAEVVDFLVARGADPNLRTNTGVTPVHAATATSDPGAQVRMIRALVAHGASPSTADSIGLTPLHYAARAGEPAAVKELLASHADVDALNSNGAAPIDDIDHWPSVPEEKQVEVLLLLLEAGGNPTRPYMKGKASIDRWTERGQTHLLKAYRSFATRQTTRASQATRSATRPDRD